MLNADWLGAPRRYKNLAHVWCAKSLPKVKNVVVSSLLLLLAFVTNGSTTLDRKRIYANPSSYSNPNPNVQFIFRSCFRTDEITLFFDQVYRYRHKLTD